MEPNNSSIVLYPTEDGKTQLDVKLENETVWLTQVQMAKTSSKATPSISSDLITTTN